MKKRLFFILLLFGLSQSVGATDWYPFIIRDGEKIEDYKKNSGVTVTSELGGVYEYRYDISDPGGKDNVLSGDYVYFSSAGNYILNFSTPPTGSTKSVVFYVYGLGQGESLRVNGAEVDNLFGGTGTTSNSSGAVLTLYGNQSNGNRMGTISNPSSSISFSYSGGNGVYFTLLYGDQTPPVPTCLVQGGVVSIYPGYSTPPLQCGTKTKLKLRSYHGSVLRWEQSSDGHSWAEIPGTKGDAYIYTEELTSTTYYRAVVKKYDCTEYSNTFEVTVNTSASAVGGSISPNSISVCGSTPEILTLSGHVGNVVQWERSTNSSFTGATIIANTTATLAVDPTSLASGTYYYRTLVNGDCSSSAYSETAEVRIGGTSGAPSGEIVSCGEVCSSGDELDLILTGYVGDVVRWESSSDMSFTSPTVINSTSVSITVRGITQTTYYRAVVQQGTCVGYSAVFALVPGTSLVITINITNSPVIPGGKRLTLSGYGSAMVINWEECEDDFDTQSVEIVAGSEGKFEIDVDVALGEKRYYRAVVYLEGCGETRSESVKVE